MNLLNFSIVSLGLATLFMVASPLSRSQGDARADSAQEPVPVAQKKTRRLPPKNLRATMARQQAKLISQQHRVQVLDAELKLAIKKMKKRSASKAAAKR